MYGSARQHVMVLLSRDDRQDHYYIRGGFVGAFLAAMPQPFAVGSASLNRFGQLPGRRGVAY
jgi:hypothetical protein